MRICYIVDEKWESSQSGCPAGFSRPNKVPIFLFNNLQFYLLYEAETPES